VAWIRNATERGERQSVDIAYLIAGVVGVVVLGVWAQSQSDIDADAFRTLNSLPGV